MKWVALLAFVLVGIGFALAVQRNQRTVLIAGFLLGFLPFVMAPWHLLIAPYSMAAWPGYVKGWEVGLIDAIALACLIGVPKSRFSLPFKYVFLTYIGSATLSVLFAPNFTIALSYPIQLARVFLVFAAVARIAETEAGLKAVIQGLFVGLTYQAVEAVLAKLGGAIQTGGSFGHQNMLGFAGHMVFIPALGLLLSGRWTRWAILGLVSGTAVIALTASRATLVFAVIGLTITYIVSASSQWTSRKGMVGIASLMAVALSFPIIQGSFAQRFEVSGGKFNQEDEERNAFARAARMMIADAPFGVGANHYVVTANLQGYSQRAGVAWSSSSRATSVHNSYLLIWAETGVLGLTAFVALLATALGASFLSGYRNRRSPEANLLFGLGGGFCAISLHSLFEWVFVVNHAQYVFAASLGLAAGLIRQFGRKGVESSAKDLPQNSVVGVTKWRRHPAS